MEGVTLAALILPSVFANRHTFGALFDRDLSEPRVRARSRQQIVDMILAWLSSRRA